ncbi:MAG TPA: permease-like cell division protein FtsX [Gaiellaceae bacterium]|nr:permease-like cell division protein FtsX [Gaiellaceae bacterium]
MAASLTVLIGMLLLGLFIALGTWTLAWSNHVKRELAVHVYFQSNATRSDENALLRRLQVNPYVKAGGIRFISKEAAFRQVAREAPDLTEALPFNPLGDTFELTPTKPEDVDRLYDSLVRPGLPHVHNVSDGRQVSHRILQVAHIVEAIFFAAAFALVAASVLLISNTIRLSVFSRRREIEVMKLVGATNWHVRAPFMVEGVLCGLIGSLVAVVLLLLGRVFLLPTIVPSLSGDADVHALGFPLTALLLLAMGLGVSALGSGLTLRRFLRV